MEHEIYDTVQFPTYALPALFNGDDSGMEDEDILNLRFWIDSLPDNCDFNIISEEEYFTNSPEFGLPCNCVDLEIFTLK